MITALWRGASRTLAFSRFALAEYVRSGRVVAEILAVVVVIWLAFWPRGNTGLDLRQLMSLGGLFLIALAAYTTAAFAVLGNRAAGYVFLARPLGRTGYLVGLQLAAFAVVLAAWTLLVTLVAALYVGNGRPVPTDLVAWGVGTVAILLNAASASLFTSLIVPLVVKGWQRLVSLGMLAIVLASYLDGGDSLGPIGTVGSVVLLPFVAGHALAGQPHLDTPALFVLGGQLLVAAALFALALAIFNRRDLTLPQ